MLIDSLLGTEKLPEQAQSHMRSVLTLIMTISFLMSLSNTFYVLFVIDKIGFTLAATSTSVMLLTQLIFDYPSGSLGDWIGQRWVLAIAFLCYNINFLLILQASTFNDFLLIGIINAVYELFILGWSETCLQAPEFIIVGVIALGCLLSVKKEFT